MTTYIKYQCSVCRRIKDIERDNVRVTPNKCTITKGCLGILLVLEQTKIQEPVFPVPGVEDWYPRGQTRIQKPIVEEALPVRLATSTNGAFVVAVKSQDDSVLPESFNITFLQRRTEDVAFNEYTYRTTEPRSVFSGRDSNGKIMRIDSAAISESRVQVRVNGVISTAATITLNTVTFPIPIGIGSLVSIRVQLEKETVEKTITVTRNSEQNPVISRGSWSNVDFVSRFNNGVYEKWWVYTVDVLAGIGMGKLKIASISLSGYPLMLLMAHEPYLRVDRYLDFIVPIENLLDGYVLTLPSSDSATLVIDRSAIEEIYPPLVLTPTTSFITPDEPQTMASSVVISDDVNEILVSSKILGPT